VHPADSVAKAVDGVSLTAVERAAASAREWGKAGSRSPGRRAQRGEKTPSTCGRQEDRLFRAYFALGRASTSTTLLVSTRERMRWATSVVVSESHPAQQGVFLEDDRSNRRPVARVGLGPGLNAIGDERRADHRTRDPLPGGRRRGV